MSVGPYVTAEVICPWNQSWPTIWILSGVSIWICYLDSCIFMSRI